MNPAISRIFISNLNFRASEADVRNLLEAYGTVQRVTIVKDRATAASRGFGFVEMQGAAEAAIAALHGSTHGGRTAGGIGQTKTAGYCRASVLARSARRKTRAARPPNISP